MGGKPLRGYGFLKAWDSTSQVYGVRGLNGFFPFFTESSVSSVRSVYRDGSLPSDNVKAMRLPVSIIDRRIASCIIPAARSAP